MTRRIRPRNTGDERLLGLQTRGESLATSLGCGAMLGVATLLPASVGILIFDRSSSWLEMLAISLGAAALVAFAGTMLALRDGCRSRVRFTEVEEFSTHPLGVVHVRFVEARKHAQDAWTPNIIVLDAEQAMVIEMMEVQRLKRPLGRTLVVGRPVGVEHWNVASTEGPPIVVHELVDERAARWAHPSSKQIVQIEEMPEVLRELCERIATHADEADGQDWGRTPKPR